MNRMRTLLLAMVIVLLAKGYAQKAEKAPGHFNIALGTHHTLPDSTKEYGVNVGLISNVQQLRGLQIGAVTAIADGKMQGVNIGGILAYSTGKVNGVQIGGMANTVRGNMNGVQIAGFVNIAHGLRGVQVGAYNFANVVNGVQLGIINVRQKQRSGYQLGIINVSKDTIAHKIGLVNVNPKTTIDLLAYMGNTSKLNLAIRFRNTSTYNIFGVGTHYMGWGEKFSGAIFYRIGQYFHLSPRWTISGDVGYYHIETFEENSQEKPERLYSVQFHVNLDYQINKTLGAFVSTGYGTANHYGTHDNYKKDFILQGGLSFRLHRKS